MIGVGVEIGVGFGIGTGVFGVVIDIEGCFRQLALSVRMGHTRGFHPNLLAFFCFVGVEGWIMDRE